MSISPLTHGEAICQDLGMLPWLSPAKMFPESKWQPARFAVLRPGGKMKFIKKCGFGAAEVE